MLGGGKDAWLAARLAELDAGNIEAIRAAARAFPLADKNSRDLRTVLGYFECFSLSLSRQYDKLAR